MPLRAFINEKEVLAPFISDSEWQDIKEQKPNIVLPCCEQSGFTRVSNLGTKHFVHHPKNHCNNWRSETWEHLLAKSEIIKACREAGYDAKTEVLGSDWKADVYAEKQLNKCLFKLALEVQWSPQTLEVTKERQKKYERDGVRCCWLFRELPSKESSYELPMFRLFFEDNYPVVETDSKNMPLGVFIKSLLEGKFHFCKTYRIDEKQTVNLVFFPVNCLNCEKKYHIYYIEGDCYSVCGKPVLESNNGRSEISLCFCSRIRKAAMDFLKTSRGRSIYMGSIKSRYSEKINDYCLSFGCPWCDEIFGKSYHFKELFKVIERLIKRLDNGQKVFHKFELYSTSKVLDWKSHWCYSHNKVFCELNK